MCTLMKSIANITYSGYVFAMPGRDKSGRRVVFSVARALGESKPPPPGFYGCFSRGVQYLQENMTSPLQGTYWPIPFRVRNMMRENYIRENDKMRKETEVTGKTRGKLKLKW